MEQLLIRLEEMQREAQTALTQIGSTAASEDWYRNYLGRGGKLTALMRGLGQLAKEERPIAGQAANRVKQALEQALSTRQEEIRQEEITAALSAEGVDVTLPGRPQVVGKLHPTTLTMREIIDICVQMGFQVYDA